MSESEKIQNTRAWQCKCLACGIPVLHYAKTYCPACKTCAPNSDEEDYYISAGTPQEQRDKTQPQEKAPIQMAGCPVCGGLESFSDCKICFGLGFLKPESLGSSQEKTLGEILFETENPFPLARSWKECHHKVKANYEAVAESVAAEGVRRERNKWSLNWANVLHSYAAQKQKELDILIPELADVVMENEKLIKTLEMTIPFLPTAGLVLRKAKEALRKAEGTT